MFAKRITGILKTPQPTTYTYDLVDNLIDIVDANGAAASYTYDSMGNLTFATNGNGNTSAYTYNLRGDLTSVTNPMGQVEQYKYDIAGKLTGYVKPSGITISYDYDKLNNLIKRQPTMKLPSLMPMNTIRTATFLKKQSRSIHIPMSAFTPMMQ